MKQTKTEQTYGKQELLEAERYREYKDLISALLENGRKYSFSEADAAIQTFLKGKVRSC